MHGQRKTRLEITPGEPQFVVRYVGKTEVYVCIGRGCTQDAVQKIWDNCYDEKGMEKVTLLITCGGIFLSSLDRKADTRSYNIRDVAYCCAERGVHDRVFSWICRDRASGKLHCHAVLCPSPERARLMSVVLHRAFNVAYRDWKLEKERKARTKANTRRQNDKTEENKNRTTTERQREQLASDDSDKGSDSHDFLMESSMAQMNIVEEEEISLTDNNIIVTE